MQFPSPVFSSYNDYYVHHSGFFFSPILREKLSFLSSHNLIPLLILNNTLFMRCRLAFLDCSSRIRHSLPPPSSSLSLCLRQKPLTTNRIHLFIISLASYPIMPLMPEMLGSMVDEHLPLTFSPHIYIKFI